jgi:hypothetical protein
MGLLRWSSLLQCEFWARMLGLPGMGQILVFLLPASSLCREWEDYFSSVHLSELIESMHLFVLKEAFFVPWEVDASASPLCRDREVNFFGAEETQVVRPPSSAKGLLQCGFFGPRAASPSPMVLEASLSSKGKDPIPEFGLICRGFIGLSSVSPSLLVVSPIIGVAELGIHSPAATSLPLS